MLKSISRGIQINIALFALLCATTALVPVHAQQPLQDGTGDGTLLLDRGGFLQFNIAESTARFGYIFDKSKQDVSFGFDLTGKLTDNKAAFINNNSIATDVEVGFSVGKKFLFSKKFNPSKIFVTKEFLTDMQASLRDNPDMGSSRASITLPSPKELQILLLSASLTAPLDDKPTFVDYTGALLRYCVAAEKTDSYCVMNGKDIDGTFLQPTSNGLKKYAITFDRLVFKGGYGYKQYNLFDPSLPFDDQLSKKPFHQPSGQLIYFSQLGGNKLLGVGVGVERANNSDDLTTVDIRDFATTINGSTTREYGRTRKAMVGDFKQYTRTFLNTDFAWFPEVLKSRIGLNFFTRSTLKGENRGIRPGVGVFFSPEGSPTHVIGGLSVSLNPNGKANIALTAGYNF